MPGANVGYGVNTRVPEGALAQVNGACASLLRGDAAALVEAGRAFEAAVAAVDQSGGAARQAPMVPWSDFHRAVERAGQLLGAIGRWQRHRHAVLFADQTGPSGYGANGRALSAPAAGSLTLEG
jgi:hypothetical protein